MVSDEWPWRVTAAKVCELLLVELHPDARVRARVARRRVEPVRLSRERWGVGR
jgi:hypothetical protein